ncbi:MAG: VTT domain-containing protein [Dehalococcoidia bacterium]|nr:VTT domain-containing protein [Dehalococcoidia bacterium]
MKSEKFDKGGRIENGGTDLNLTSEEGAAQVKRGRWIRRHSTSLIIIIAIIVFSVVIYFTGALLGDIEAYGYLGVFLICVIGSAAVIIPVPSMPVVMFMGAVLNPWLVALMVGLGEPIGELTCYMAGYSGRMTLENRRFYDKLQNWMRRRGSVVLFLFACGSNPIFDIVGATAGALRYPLWKFILILLLGKTVKGLLLAFAGYGLLRLLLKFLIG